MKNMLYLLSLVIPLQGCETQNNEVALSIVYVSIIITMFIIVAVNNLKKEKV